MRIDDRGELDRFLSEEAVDPAKPILLIGELIGSWRVCAYLGGGGFGEVYRVEHIKVGLVCALKILRRESCSSRERFCLEAKVLANHPHSAMPCFYELGEIQGRPYIVMELLTPRELPRSDRDVAKLLRQLCGVLSSLHDLNYVHRDVKPSNVLYRQSGEAVLVDYGLIKKSASSGGSFNQAALTRANMAIGTERYAAPEQLIGGSVDVSADIHALGVLADSCFKGNAPWRWNRLIRRATSSIPGQRFKSVKAFERAIAWRFAMEGVVILASILVMIIATMTPFVVQQRVQKDADDEATTNTATSAHSGNASDSASEWL